MYMLDTNIVSHALRDPRGRIAMRIRRLPPQDLAISIIVAAELRFGIKKRASPTLTALVEGFLARIAILPFDGDADQHYAILRTALETVGTPIGGNDMLIAAHALALDAIQVTDNTNEFSQVKDLKFENWKN
jgi:tRNA(fMet)-specific endonuclease VapC